MKIAIDTARALALEDSGCRYGFSLEKLEAFESLIRADAIAKEREAITEEWSMCVQSDLEHGVSYLNEKATEHWFKSYPEISKFWAWLDARSNT
jgi:hypothetical protein